MPFGGSRRERAVTLADVDHEPLDPARGRPARDVPAQRSPADTVTVVAPARIGMPVGRPPRSRWRTALATVVAVVPLLVVAGVPFLFHS